MHNEITKRVGGLRTSSLLTAVLAIPIISRHAGSVALLVHRTEPHPFNQNEIDLSGHIVRLRKAEVRLSPTEFALLKQLITNAGKVLTHRMLLQSIWGPEYGGEAEYLRVYINRLRQKLEPDPANPRYLLTEPGVGYRFVAPESEGAHGHPPV